MILTFYSYKGGVGRTMAVANVATLLARQGFSVIAMDWDLEAPGLHRYFGLADDQVSKGVIDYLYDYKSLLSSETEITDLSLPQLSSYLMPILEHQTVGNLWLMPSGQQNALYAGKVSNFDWVNFYEHWDGGRCIEFLKRELRKRANFILVDSRTGISDIGGICTAQLPDLLVLMFGTNLQSTVGLEEIAEGLVQNSRPRSSQREPLLLPVPSRIEDRMEYDLLKHWGKQFQDVFARFLPPGINPTEYFDNVRIPYVPKFSFGEQLAVIEEDPAQGTISRSYYYLSQLIRQYAPFEIILAFADNAEDHTRDSLTSVTVSIPALGADSAHCTFVSPVTDDSLKNLHRYLTNHWMQDDKVGVQRADSLETHLIQWGEKLFQAVFGDPAAFRLFVQFREQPSRSRLLTIQTVDPNILRLPWELLSDGKEHLVNQGICVRRQTERPNADIPAPVQLPTHILVLVARPEGMPFADPRATSQAILDAIGALGMDNATAEFVNPPTLRALDQRLKDKSRAPAHAVQLDTFIKYEAADGRCLLGLEDEAGKLDWVNVDHLSRLLKETLIDLVVLDSPSVTPETDYPFALNLLQRDLIAGGISNVVGIQYGVPIETRRRFFASFYRALTEGCTVAEAVDNGRRDMLRQRAHATVHHPLTDRTDVDLVEWFLPTLYQRAGDYAPFAGVRPRPAVARDFEGLLHGEFPVPRYGFIGRARELWQLQRLLNHRRVVMLCGTVGVGKTALATETCRWLTRIGIFSRAVYISIGSDCTSEQIITQTLELLSGSEIPASATSEQKLDSLRVALIQTPTLIVWDQLGTTATQADTALRSTFFQALEETAHTLTLEGTCRVLVTTRSPELPLGSFARSPSIAWFQLTGLSTEDSRNLAQTILDAQGLRHPSDAELNQLLGYLKGDPGAIETAISLLRDRPQIAEIIEQAGRGRGSLDQENFAPTVTFLHFSDLCFRKDPAEHGHRRDVVLHALFDDIARQSAGGSHPEFVFVTGDIAYSGRHNEYQLATRLFFDPLLEFLKIRKDRLFVIPGNHDIDRGAVDPFLANGMQPLPTSQRAIREFLMSSPSRSHVLQKFRAYSSFVENYFGDALKLDSRDLSYNRLVTVRDYKIAVLGFNSAWMCGISQDSETNISEAGRQPVGIPLLEEAFSQSEQRDHADLRVALLHHPTDWLAESERAQVETQLDRGCDILLHGHQHLHGIPIVSYSRNDGPVHIATGSFFPRSDRLYGTYNLIQVDLSSGRGRVYSRRYDESKLEWAENTVGTASRPDGSLEFRMQTLERRAAIRTPSNGRKKILIVDDSESWQMVMMNMLQGRYDLTVASSYFEAHKRVKTEYFDLIVTNLCLMGDTDYLGLQLLEDTSDRKIPTIVVTGSSPSIRGIFERYADVVDIFVKGRTFSATRFCSVVQKALAREGGRT